ncbi:MAG: hypothetical protein ABJA82_04520 [Myxococcales bacterium]
MFLLLASLAGGCATPAMRVPGVQVVPSRVVALPTDGVVWEWDFSGNRVVSEQHTVEAVRNVDNSIDRRLRPLGGRSVAAETLDGLPSVSLFHDWATRMLKEIMAERLGRARSTHESVAEWRYSKELTTWRDELKADFVLVSMFMDGRNTAGRSLAVMFAGGALAARRAITCVVRLQDGRVVWCNLIDFQHPLDEPGGAQLFVHTLLDDLLGSPFNSSTKAGDDP